MPQTYPDGTTAGGGKFVMRGGQWYPNTSPTVVGTPDPTQALKLPTAQADLDAKRQEAEIRRLAILKAERELPPDPAAVVPTGGASGDDYLKTLPAADAQLVKGIASGKIQLPANAMRSPYWQKMLGYVVNYDPQFDGINYNSRAATRKDFTSGKAASNIRALNTGIGHLGKLYDQIDGTYGMSGFPGATTVNAIGNAISRSSGSSGVTKFEQTAGAVASELTQIFRGSGGAEADVKRYLEELNSSGSKEQKQEAAKNIMGLLKSRLDALGDQYSQGMGTTAEPLRLLDPEAQKTFNTISGVDGGAVPGGQSGPGGIPGGGNGPSGGSDTPPSFGGRPLENLAINPEDPHKGVDPRTLGGAAEGYADPGTESIATQFKSVPNPKKAQAYSDLITFLNGNPNANDADVRAFVARNPIYPGGFADSLVEYHNKTHRWAAAPGDLNDQVPLTDSDKTYNRVFGGPEATGIISAANAGSFDLASLGASIINPESGRKFNMMRAENPKSALTGDIVGSLAGLKLAELGTKAFLPKLTDGMVERGWLTAARAKGLVAPVSEGIYGGITGAASNPEHPFAGGALGAIATPASGGAGRMVGGRLVEPAARGVGRMMGFGTPKPSAIDSSITKAVGNNSGDIQRALAEASGLNLPMMLADTNPQLRSLAGASVRRSPTASGIAENALIPRGRGQIDRFQGAIQRDLGPTANIPQLSDEMIKAARLKAGPLYDQAYAAPPIASPKINEILNTPFGQDGLKQAIAIAKNERVDPNALSVDFNAAGEPVMRPTPNTRTLDLVKRGMDDVLEKYRNPITGRLDLNDMGQSQNNVKTDMLKEIDLRNPAYGQARAAYAGPAQEKDWISRGGDAFKLDPNTLSFNASKIPADKMPMAQLGYRGALSDAGNSVGYGSNPFERTLGTPAAESRLSTMYPDSPGPARLLRQRDLERQMQNTSNDILGNSKTAGRGIADEAFAGEDLPQLAFDVGSNLLMGQVPIGTMVKANLGRRIADAYKLGVGKRATAKADALAPILMNPNPVASMDELSATLARTRSYSDYIARRRGIFGAPVGVIGAGTFSGLANQ